MKSRTRVVDMVKMWNAQLFVVIKERYILKNIDIDGGRVFKYCERIFNVTELRWVK